MKIKGLTILIALFCVVFTIVVSEQKTSANMFYFNLVGGAPLVQDWSDTTQITTDDNWTGVISIQGFRGDGLVSGTGVDPQTVLADGQSTPMDVNANETNPDTFSTGGVAEFEIADPSVGIKGSATADAPHLMIYLDTTPCPATKSLSIRYDVRDLDGSSNDAVQQVALQYRVGTTGNFTNLAAGFVADATEPNAATKVTSKFVQLPVAIVNQPQVELRIITTNAAGTDEWVGIDNLQVGCFFPTSATVSAGGRVLTSDGRGINGANVSILDTLTQQMQFARTNQFGYFNFNDLDAGGIYLITVGHRSYRFTSGTNAVQLLEDKKDFFFYADAPINLQKKSRSVFSDRKSKNFRK